MKSLARGLAALGVACVLLVSSIHAYALSSCQGLAGQGFGGTDAFFCVPNGPTDFSAAYDVNGTTASTHLSFANGAIGGSATQAEVIGNARFAGEIIQDIRIIGPATAGPLPIHFGFSVHGDITENCLSCSGQITGHFKIQNVQGPTLILDSTVSTTSIGGDWVSNATAFGPGASVNSSSAPGSGIITGAMSFDAQPYLGLILRVVVNLGGSVGLNGPGQISVNASDTSLFNFFLPDGYSLVAEEAAYLSTPLLQPVPVPGALCLLASALGVAGLRVSRRR